MKNILQFALLLFCSQLLAQQIPKVTVQDEADLRLRDLHVHVEIIGNIAVTTYDMKFYNGLNRVLEGELVFPLGEGQSVSNFAMDVNGRMREAAIVEKELGRVAYENTMRQVIDPGLLEKTEGNNYRARVYPIPAKGTKHVIVTFEQSLQTLEGKQSYELPLGFKEKLDNFSVRFKTYTAQTPVIVKSEYKASNFQKKDDSYIMQISKTHHKPKKPLVVQIPNTVSQENMRTYNHYFHYTKVYKPSSRLKKKPRKITLLWDTSFSMQYRDLTKEIAILQNYLSYLHTVEVSLYTFSNEIHQQQNIRIENGDANTLIALLKKSTYDGGTRMDVFKDLRFRSDETLLFSDGLANLGDFATRQKSPVYTINSLNVSNHEYLKQLATDTGGNYLNLSRITAAKAVEVLKNETFQFLGIKNNTKLFEVYPQTRVNVWEDFSISGQFVEATTIELLFGYGGKVTEKVQVAIQPSEGTEHIKRLWAKEKLAHLHQNKEANKDRIVLLSKQYRILTDFTSMIVLDRLEDYVRYKIEPPAELLESYKELLAADAEAEKLRQEQIALSKEEIQEDYQDIVDWYFGKKKVVEKPKETTTNTMEETLLLANTRTEHTTTAETNSQTTENSDRLTVNPSSTNTITGIVTDEDNQPLPGATIQIKDTNHGTTTDFDGNFTLNADEGAILIISYVGYDSVQLPVNASEVNVQLKINNQLDEVVVVAYGGSVNSAKVASAIATVETESIDKVLLGQANGVSISTGNGQPGQSTQIIIRGRNSHSSDGDLLFIIDCVPVDEHTFRQLQQADVKNITTLNQAEAAQLYGNRAINGVVIVTTKNGNRSNTAMIDSLNQEIESKITLKPWNADVPYIKLLEKEKTVADAYQKYISIREEYANMPTFYLDVADFFNERNATKLAVTVLTNLVEIELSDYELLKAAAYKLEYFERMELAVKLYEKVLELRPEEPQSYRDLALAYEQVGNFEKSYDLLYKIYDGQLLEKDEQENYLGMEAIAFTELSRLTQKQRKILKVEKETLKKLPNMPVDVRVVIDWNHADTDIDLWVVDPNGEKAYYRNPTTEIGGRMSEDLTQGYGPEDFMLKNAIEGEYTVYVNHYAHTMQKVSGPTILKITLYTNYGKKNETKKTSVVRLEKKSGNIEVGNLFFTK